MQASGDADIDIVEAADSLSLTKSTTLMERKHILVFLLLHSQSVPGSTSGLIKQKTTQYRITVLKSVLGRDISKQPIFAHACTWCDTTSRVYGMGKKAMIHKLIRGNPILVNCTYSTVL